MSNKPLSMLMMICCLCLLGNASKECGNMITKCESRKAAGNKQLRVTKAEPENEDQGSEFSLINMIFFQTS